MIVETLLYAHGQYTPNTVRQACQVVGAIGAALDAAFHHNVCDTDVDDSYRKRYDYSADVATFCTEYMGDWLFDRVPDRAHCAFTYAPSQHHFTAQ